jgi:CSLREA domain-containing protein
LAQRRSSKIVADACKLFVGVVLLFMLAGWYGTGQGASVIVNTQEDELNRDGDCSLREAILAANTGTSVDACSVGSGANTIGLSPGIYILTLAGDFEDAGATGDLDLQANLVIRGVGARSTIIDGNNGDRVFDILPGARVVLSDLAVRGGSIDGNGGGIENEGKLIITRVTVSDNFAVGDGGGIYNSGVLAVSESTIATNSAFNSGAGISNAGDLAIVTSTLSGNKITYEFGADRGGGFRNLSGAARLNNVTINENQATTGGGIVNDGGTVQVKNVIVANSPAHTNCDGINAITSQGYNLDSGATCGFNGPGDLSNMGPQLGPLANNGGTTNTHALLPGSPAIDAGTNNGCPATDQRGVLRPQDGDGDGTAVCDIGAYELKAGQN